MFVHTYFALRYFPNRYFPGPIPVEIEIPAKPTFTGGQFVLEPIPGVLVRSDLVFPTPELKAFVVVYPATVTVHAYLRVPPVILSVDWQTFAPTSTSGYPRKRTQAQDEAEQLLEHYMLTLQMVTKGRK